MNVKLRRLLMPLLRHDAAGKPPTFRTRSAARQAIYLIEKPVSLKKTQGRLRRNSEKQSARASHNQETAAIREEVFKRAGQRCELCKIAFTDVFPGHMDHWLSGGGRRRQKQAVENCWALCRYCHQDRTLNRPSTGWWNDRFALHCQLHGFNFIPHIEHAEPAKAGGAP